MAQIKIKGETITKDTILAKRELGYGVNVDKKIKVGDGTKTYENLPHLTDSNELSYLCEVDKNNPDGRNIATVFADEIANYSNIYAFLAARSNAGNFEGLHLGDYIDVPIITGTIAGYNIGAQTMRFRIVAFDPYYGYGDTENGHHIIFFPDTNFGNIRYNPTNNNNGTADQNNPWLASELYAVANGVNNYSTNSYNSVAHGADGGAGLISLMPSTLTSLMKNLKILVPRRYSASGLLTMNNETMWVNRGKLFALTEPEAYGMPIHTAGDKDANGYNRECMGTPVGFPYLVGSAGKRNHRCNRASWWLAAVPSGSSTLACVVGYGGYAYAYDCSNTTIGARLGFAI